MASYERKQHSGNATATTLAGAISSTGAVTISIASATGWPDCSVGPFVATIDRGNSGEEKVLVTARTGTNLTVTAGNRGYDSSTAATHALGVSIEHTFSAVESDEANALAYRLANATSGLPFLGGGAATLPTAAQVDTAGIADNAINANKIAADAVGSSEIATGAVGSAEIADGSVGTSELTDLGVTTGKINDLAVTTGKINDAAVTTAKINDLGVTTGKINDLAVTTGKLAADSVTAAKIADGTITIAELATALQYYLANGGDIKAGVWSAAPSAGWALIDGSTITGAQSSYPETWANAPTAWRSGSNLVLPDWRGLTLVNFKTGDSLFGTLAGTGGAKTVAGGAHTHALSSAGQALITLGATTVQAKLVAVSSWTPTDARTVSSTSASSRTDAAELSGATDSGTPAATSVVQPYATINYAICLK